MDSIGAEVGQKMRSAIKAKLMELDCYVDDELPDYIMVMVANKRTKSQMNEDLSLFLATKTATFVNWLHIVLKKLKEVTVTNPEVYKKAAKRKLTESSDAKVKKEKKDKKIKKEGQTSKSDEQKSLTDDLPITANKLSEQRKIVLLSENKCSEMVTDDNFDIPLLSEVNASSERELEDIEKKIRNVKSRLGLLVESEEEDQDCLSLKIEKDELFSKHEEDVDDSNTSNMRKISIIQDGKTEESFSHGQADTFGETNSDQSYSPEKRKEHKRIIFNKEESSPKKPSILERLGKRSSDFVETTLSKRKISLTEYRKEEERFLGYLRDTEKRNEDRERNNRHNTRSSSSRRSSREKSESTKERRRNSSRDRSREKSSKKEQKKESVLNRLGVMSKVSVPQKSAEEPTEEEEEEVVREVPSLIKVKPRIIPPDVPQPNKNLLLKAVAEAQRSIAQTPKVGNTLKPDALFTKKYKEKSMEEKSSRKLPENEKNKLRNLITQSSKASSKYVEEDDYDTNGEYIPKPVKKVQSDVPKYVPSSKKSGDESDMEDDEVKHQFIITLDGIEKTKLTEKKSAVKARLDGRKTPSPIIFDKVTTKVKSKPNIPDKLPVVHPPLSVKNKERCKYWPNCRQGDKCEFVHPTSNCEMFPHCKFGEKCLYLHPHCKFGSSCTKRDCPYDHSVPSKTTISSRTSSSKLITSAIQNCKFFPNCTNGNCPFYHPKPCKYGKYCKNQAECNFSHGFIAGKGSLSWRLK